MRQTSLIKRAGIALTALLSLIAFTTTTLAQCSPRNRRVVVQQQRYVNQNSYYQQGPYYGQPQYGQPQYGPAPYGYDNYNPEYDRGPSKTKNVLIGGALGAIGGALIGGKTGAVIGAGAGAGAGYVIYRAKKRSHDQQYNNYPYYNRY